MGKWTALATIGLLGMLLGSCGDDGDSLLCGPGTEEKAGQCVASSDSCGQGTIYNPETSLCEPAASCAPGTTLLDGACHPDGSVICESGTTYNVSTGQCQADIRGCGSGTVLIDGSCLPADDALVGSAEELAEPNDNGRAGALDLPDIGSNRTLNGCITPADADGDGTIDIDVDSFRLTSTGPALLDISIDGLGGLAGAFTIVAESGLLADDGWTRMGLNLVGDTSRRQVFLPSAGDYLLDIADSRSLLSSLPVGSGETCYFASISTLAMPAAVPITSAASGTLGDAALFFSYDPVADGDFIEDLLLASASPSAEPALVHMREGRYAGSSQGSASLSGIAGGLHNDANLIIVVESAFHYSLDPVPFDYSLERFPVPQIQSGTAITVEPGQIPQQELVWFEASAGDIVHVRVDDPALDLFSLERDLSGLRSTLCLGCSGTDLYYQAEHSGIFYLSVANSAAVSPFAATLELASETATPLSLDVPVAAQELSADGTDFFDLNETNLSWNLLEASPTAFTGDLQVQRYPRGEEGFLGHDLVADEILLFSGGAGVGGIVDLPGQTDTRRSLLRIDDAAFDGLADDEVYDLSISGRDFALLQPTPGAPSQLAAVSIDAGATQFYWLEATPGERFEVSLSQIETVDLAIDLLSADESAFLTIDDAGAATDESLLRFMDGKAYQPIAVRNISAVAGSYDLRARIVAEDELSAGSGGTQVLPGAGSVTETITIGTDCMLDSLRVDVDIQGANIGDMLVTLSSPLGTAVNLHAPSGDTSDSLVGSYPGTLVPAESLGVLAGETSLGDWTLSVSAQTFAKLVNGWSVAVYCQL